MKNTIVSLVKKTTKKFAHLLITAMATAIGEMILGSLFKGFTKIKEHRKSEPIVDTEADVKNVEDKVETEEVEDKVETEEEPEKMENEEN